MKTKVRIGTALFVAAFFLLCLIPLLGMVFLPEQTAVGNEHLSQTPMLFQTDGTLNGNILSDVTSYVSDHIGLRHEMITLNSWLNSTLFGTVTNEDVLLGKDGWLFYTATLADYQGTDRMTGRQCYAAGKTLQLIQEYCRSQGADFLFTIAPNKNSLYPEYMPGRYASAPAEMASNAQQLAAVLQTLDVAYADLFAPLREEEDVLYFQTDSHWNDRGAALAGDVLCRALGLQTEDFYPGPYHMEATHSGDLYEMVYPAGTLLEDNAVFEREFTFAYAQGYRSPEDITIRTSSAAQTGSLLMFRDSFGNSLHAFMAERFGAACFSRAMPYNLSWIERESADTVVIELVERNLSWLNTKPPILPAPEREIRFPAAEGDFSACAAVEASDSLTDYLQVAGTINCPGMDENSPIYLRVNGDKVYEATPAGSGEVPFTAFVPAQEELEFAELCISINGELTVCTLELTEN